MAQLMVREFKSTDTNSAVDLYISVFSQAPWNDELSKADIELYFQRLQSMDTFMGYVLLDSNTEKLLGVSIGFIRPWYRGEQYHMDSFYVSFEDQGKGLGSFFLDQIKKELFAINMPYIVLDTEKGMPAENFYRKNGFVSLDDSVNLVCEIIRS
jgi:aminoglycoside 6'-N-acetyltransferase I